MKFSIFGIDRKAFVEMTDGELLASVKLWRLKMRDGERGAAEKVHLCEQEMSMRFGGATTLAADLTACAG